MQNKPFTVDEANALLPDLEEVFRHMDGLRARIQEDTDKLQVLDVLWGPSLREPGNPDRKEFLHLRAAVREAMKRLRSVVQKEVLDRGIRLPPGGVEQGLLDFPTTYEGRWVFLCWQRGEKEIEAWHELEGGYRGRRPLTGEHALLMGRDGRGGEDLGPPPPGM